MFWWAVKLITMVANNNTSGTNPTLTLYFYRLIIYKILVVDKIDQLGALFFNQGNF